MLPRVPFRQWTLAFPRVLKLALASEPAVLSEALHAFARSIFAYQRRCARRLGVEKPRPGAVAFIQWFSTALLLHPHDHVLVPDGVFHGEGQEFAPLPPPSRGGGELLRKVATRVCRLAQARFPDGLPYAEDAQRALQSASVQTKLPLGEEAFEKKRRRCALLEGFSLHANTWVHENDWQTLEALCRYGARGPLALARLSFREDGKLEYRLKKPVGGASVLVMTPLQLCEQLVPAKSAENVAAAAPPAPEAATPAAAKGPRRPRLDWQSVLRRTFGFDVFDCPCGGRRRVLAVIDSPELARKILGLPPRSPPPWRRP